jgi:hypothetical protein
MSPNNTFTVPVRVTDQGLIETVEGDPVCAPWNAEAAQIIVDALNAMMLINRLRDGPGRSVTILCDNDDPAHRLDQVGVEVQAEWTGAVPWSPARFMDETVIGALDQAEGARRAAEASGGRVYDGLDGPKLTSVDPETLGELRAASGVGGAGWLAPHSLPVGGGHVHVFVEQMCDCGAWLNPADGVIYTNLRPLTFRDRSFAFSGGGVYVEHGTQVAPTFPPECYGTGCDEFPGVRS